MRQLLQQFYRNKDGATIVEFSIVAVVFFTLLLGIIEFGLFMFHKVTIESITMQAGREATLGRSNNGSACATATDRVSYIQCFVKARADALIHGNRVVVDVQPVNSASNSGTYAPDICLDNPNNPSSAPTSCGPMWQEVNGTPGYQGAQTALDMGAYGDLVEVRVSYPWQVVIPLLGRYFGDVITDASGVRRRTGVVMITSSTVVKNEPL